MIAWGLGSSYVRILLVTPDYSMQLNNRHMHGHPTCACACGVWSMQTFQFRFGPPLDNKIWSQTQNLANVMGNYTNAVRHQLQHCYLSLNNETLPGEENEVGPGDVYGCSDDVHMHLFVTPCACLSYTTLWSIYACSSLTNRNLMLYCTFFIYMYNDSLPRKYNLGIFIHNIFSKPGL